MTAEKLWTDKITCWYNLYYIRFFLFLFYRDDIKFFLFHVLQKFTNFCASIMKIPSFAFNEDRYLQFSRIQLLVFIFLFISLFLAYSNSFQASWQFDDTANILYNSRIHIEDLMPSSLLGTLFAHPKGTGSLYRPIPCLTFAINWYIGKTNPIGYHVFNLFFHILTAFFLYLAVSLLLKAPNLKDRFSNSNIPIHFIAFVTSALWALHPIQIQSVTYIVQRMSLLAGFFSIIGIYFYLKFRLKKNNKYLPVIPICFIFAVFSKENAFLFPLNVFIVEIIFFQNITSINFRKYIIIGILIAGILFVFGSIFFLNSNFFLTINEPGNRYYTPLERLITQPRVLLFYISQIFYPYPSRFSIEHDCDFSTSLFKPWTTLPSILIVIFLIIIAISNAKKYPIFSFAILFFFLNHSIESSLINLELVFEHRNYLPSMFIFLPFAAVFYNLTFSFQKKFNFGNLAIPILITLVFIFLGWATYTRNQAWETVRTLWMDAVKKAPKQARPLNFIAIDLAWGKNVTPAKERFAYKLLERSLTKNMPRKEVKGDIIGNMALLQERWGNYEKALELFNKALSISPNLHKVRFDLITTHIKYHNWPEALDQIDILISKDAPRVDYLNVKGLLLLWIKKPKEALELLRLALQTDPNRPDILLNIGVALLNINANFNAEWFLKSAMEKAPSDILTIFALINFSLKNNDLYTAKKYANYALSRFTLLDIISNLNSLPTNYSAAPISSYPLSKWLIKYYQNAQFDTLKMSD